MPGKLTLFPPRRAARFLIVRDGETLEIGRDPRCGLVVDAPGISKRHARLRWTGDGWVVEDLASKNGTTVNGLAPGATELRDGDWISLGGLMGRYERLTAAQAAMLDSHRLARIQTSAEMRRRLSANLEPIDLLLRLLESAMEATQTERGFVLVAGRDGRLRAEVAAGFTAEELHEERFRGSAGAVREVFETGEPAVVSNAVADPRLGNRPSVVTQGIGCLACLALRHGAETLGVIYVDSQKVGPTFTESDIEALEILAGHTARILAESQPRWEPAPADGPVLMVLQQRISELFPVP